MRSLLNTTLTIPTHSKLPKCHHTHNAYAFPSLKLPFLNFLVPSKYPFLQKQSKKRVVIIKSSMESKTDASTKPFSVLFVCLGNICRSPAAEGVFTDLVKKKGLDSKFKIDSAGTINYHEGNEADPRMRTAARKRGIAITSISRPIKPSDFRDFDLILVMDEQNKADVFKALEKWIHKEPLPADAAEKVRLMCSYCKKHEETEVPDPYYGGAKGFEKVLDLLEDACESLLESIVAENKI
ncbi:putative serine/threonine-protein kinase KIPK-like [Capsicum annuum]|uniref:putative low molecular weight protein-tyrosine-phosphatase slr0328 n=1 Tax=Capsicum annuum TaxID=4072 RepID=UPI0007BF818A|nr:putative low molecular weight protein-tyrosine-phosphatase slr0328 [Capsicum annuum]KAF3621402.1 putative serine/threonine-protein kinase KIPK-like [Capsicum annuum]